MPTGDVTTIHRTLILTTFFPPRIGGAERAIAQLAEGLDPGRVVVVAPPAPNNEFTDAGVRYRIVRRDLHAGAFRPSWLFHLPWLLTLVRRERCTRILCAHYGGFVTAAMVIFKLTRIPYLVWIHGLDLTAYQGSSWSRRILVQWNLRFAEWVFANSEPTRRRLLDSGVPFGKTFVSHPGVVVVRPPDRSEVSDFRSRVLQDPPGPVLLTVGRLVGRKGHARILRALPRVLRNLPTLRYLVVGDGPERNSLEHLARQLGVQHCVRFTGRVAERDLRLAYASADLFAMLPYDDPRDVEGFGMVYAEAMAAGCPVLATNTGGIPDIVTDGRTGLLLDPDADEPTIAQTLITLLRDSGRLHRFQEQGRVEVANRFSLSEQCAPVQRALAVPSVAGMGPRVSVVVPVWRDTTRLASTLGSIQRQTHQDLEIIVVDDGSDAPVEPIVRGFPGVQYVRQPHRGAPAARNRGFAESSGRFVLFCDADVHLHPRMLERCLTTLQLHSSAAFAYVNFRFGWRTFDLFDFDPERLRASNYISTMSLIRRERFPGFDESLPRLQDWDLWLTVVERGGTGVWVPAHLFSASLGTHAISAGTTLPPEAIVRRVRGKHGLP